VQMQICQNQLLLACVFLQFVPPTQERTNALPPPARPSFSAVGMLKPGISQSPVCPGRELLLVHAAGAARWCVGAGPPGPLRRALWPVWCIRTAVRGLVFRTIRRS
jgi:hypothetical protein